MIGIGYICFKKYFGTKQMYWWVNVDIGSHIHHTLLEDFTSL